MSPVLGPGTMAITCFAGVLAVVFLLVSFRKRALPLPPGPKASSFMGHIRELNPKGLWFRTMVWAKEYGDVCYLHKFGQPVVFLNSPEAAHDLLDKRGSIYSDRPQSTMINELCGCGSMVAFVGYGEKSKRQRRLIHLALGPQSIPTYHSLLAAETKRFVIHLLADPSGYSSSIRRYAGALTLLTVYGYEAQSKDDGFITMAEDSVSLLAHEISGGRIWLVDIFPALKYIPTWFPGAGFKVKASKWKAKMEEFVDIPFELVKTKMREGSALPSFCSSLLQQDARTVDAEREMDVKWTANSMYSASIETTMAVASHFILAMTQHPEILIKAQEEIENVVGHDRLPNFGDRSSLRYVDCIMTECLRWACPVPLNLPHLLMEHDSYRDMHIPKGSFVIANIWAMLRDSRMYPEPDTFNPDRFMEQLDREAQRKRDPRNVCFGFGRRRCPGADLIESSVWLLIATMLAVFDISKAVDELGNPIEPEVEYHNPVFRTPTTFKCSIRPRSERVLKLVENTTE